MILQLSIKNFGLVDDLSLEFSGGLSVFTGETGAGKSILIDACRFALGERFDTALVREPSLPSSVEVVFDLSRQKEIASDDLFKERMPADDPQIIISRSYLPDGRARVRVNGQAVTIAELRAIGDRLVDFHGPHDHQMLLSSDLHLGMLDRLCDLKDEKAAYAESFRLYAEAKRGLEEIEGSAASRDRDIDLLAHQVRELQRVPLDAVKHEELKREQVRLNNAERLFEAATALLACLEGSEASAGESLGAAFGPMKTLLSIDPDAERYQTELGRLQEGLQELAGRVRAYLDGLSFEPEAARDINGRCDAYDEIIRKYGPTIEAAAAFYREAKKRYDFLVNLETNDADMRSRINVLEKDARAAAGKISRIRKRRSKELKATVEAELKELGISHVEFEVRFEDGDLGRDGSDRVIFYISPNVGEELKPLSSIVSSGEAARVMLALKKALTDVDRVPVLIFDEIDAQIGGRLGTVTGNKLRELSRKRHVILVTHLPQIASFADEHFKVSKRVAENRTVTVVEKLVAESKVRELAQMMSGEKATGISVSHAEEMLAKARLKAGRDTPS